MNLGFAIGAIISVTRLDPRRPKQQAGLDNKALLQAPAKEQKLKL